MMFYKGYSCYLIAGYVTTVAIVLDKAPNRKADKADNTTGEPSRLLISRL